MLENLIKILVKKDYNKLESLLKSDECTTNDYINILHVLFFMHINGHIDDDQIFSIFYLTLNKKVKVVNISYLFDEIYNLNMDTSNKIQQFLKFNRDYLLLDDGIKNIVTKMKKSTGKKKFDGINNNNFYEYVNDELTKIINSFTDTGFINSMQYDSPANPVVKNNTGVGITIQLGNQNMSNANNKLRYKTPLNVYENEIRKRLMLLMKMFGFDLVSFMGVNIITNGDFKCMNFNEKVNYYKNCSQKLKDSLATIKEMARKRRQMQLSYDVFKKQYDDIKNANHNINNYKSFNNIMTDLVNKYLT